MKYVIKYVKCDRCKAVFEEGSQKTVMWMKCQSFNGREHLSEGDKTYNFCKECEKSFIEWFFFPERKSNELNISI